MRTAVQTTRGRLRGSEEDGVLVFRGVPFAAPPTGELRFQPPQPPEPWSSVREASEFGPAAPQGRRALSLPGLQVERQSEDCLYLNVYTPGTDDSRRPVLFWIHGGAYVWGAGSMALYDGVPLARRGGAVVVTINYRLGALGFLQLAGLGGEGFGATPNAGLIDQIAALRWLRDNIAAFGGDPRNVTVFGESAGGMSVTTLLATPSARGLFRRAIAQSGVAHYVHSRRSATRVAEALLEDLGVPPGAAEKLREVPVEELLEAQTRRQLEVRMGSTGLAFVPVVDGEVLPERPLDAVARGRAAHVSLLLGTNRDEWKLFRFVDPAPAEFDGACLLERVAARVPGPDSRARARQLIESYRKAREGRASTEPLEIFSAIDTDRAFRIPAIQLAEVQRTHQPQTWKYLFTWESPAEQGLLGACHALEIPFVFGTLGLSGLEPIVGNGPEATALCETMMDAWLAFARCGDPNHAGLPAWAPYDAERRPTFVFGRERRLEHDPLDEERRAWDGIL